MSIVQIHVDDVLHRCDACGFERTIGFDLIEIGVIPDAEGHLDGDGVDPAEPLVALPSGNRCGSVELIRLPAPAPPGGGSDDLARMWERMGGEALDLSCLGAEPSTEDVS